MVLCFVTDAGRVYDEDGYMLIERHLDVADGYFTSEGANSGIENADDPYANTYSIIGALDESKYLLNGQYYAFKLIYEYTPGRYDITEDVLEWTQTSWLTESSVTGADLSNIDDSKADNPKQAFAGLAKSSNPYTYLDGDNGDPNAWAHSVVTTELSYRSDDIVGHEDRFAYGQSLWVRLGIVLVIPFIWEYTVFHVLCPLKQSVAATPSPSAHDVA